MLCRKLPCAVAVLLGIACGSSSPKTTGTSGQNQADTSQTNTAPTLTAIAVSPSDVAVPAGISAQFTASGTFSDGSTRDVTSSVTWTAVDPSCAAARTDVVGAFGTTSACATTITARDAATGLSGTASLTVVSVDLQTMSIAIAPIDPTLLVGATLKLTANGTLSDGSIADFTIAVGWKSSDGSVATIDPDGTLHAIAAGTATITATEPTTGLYDTTTVTVTTVPGVLSYLSLKPGSVIGGSARTVVGAVALDSPAQADKTVNLTSSNPGVVGVPASVTIAAGASSATFQVTTTAVDHRVKVTITATTSDANDPTKTATLNVRKAH